MKIKVNGSEIALEKEVTVKELLDIRKVEMQEYVTVQVNEDILSNDGFDTSIVKDGDVVEFLYFMGGGTL